MILGAKCNRPIKEKNILAFACPVVTLPFYSILLTRFFLSDFITQISSLRDLVKKECYIAPNEGNNYRKLSLERFFLSIV